MTRSRLAAREAASPGAAQLGGATRAAIMADAGPGFAVAVERAPWASPSPVRQAAPTARARRAGLSLLCHLALAAIVVGASLLHPPMTPVDPPSVDLVIGNGADASGLPQPTPPAPPPVPPSSAPTPPPAAASVPSPPPALPPTPPPSPAGTIAAAPPVAAPPPPQARQPAPASAPVPVAPPAQAPRPAPPAVQAAQPEMNIRLGSGLSAPFAEIEDTGLVHPAESEIGNVPPEYPPEAAARHESGRVRLAVRVGPDGSVLGVMILRSSGSRALDAAARDRVATWHFRPATRNGKPVGDVVELPPIDFVPD
jgi:protein TonB